MHCTPFNSAKTGRRPVDARYFRAIADSTFDWENWFDTQGRLLWVSPSVERITGYSVAECLEMENYCQRRRERG